MYVASMVSCIFASLERSLCDLAATDLQVLVVVSLHQRAGPGGRSKQRSSFIQMYTTSHVCTTLPGWLASLFKQVFIFGTLSPSRLGQSKTQNKDMKPAGA